MIQTKPLAARSGRVASKGAFQARARAKELEAQGLEIIHLEIGELDFDTPAHVVEAGVTALQNGRTRYGPAAGTVELREAIAGFIEETRGVPAPPEQIVVTAGVKGALHLTIMALIDHRDEVIIPDPGFPAYPSIIRSAGGVPVSLPLRIEHGFQPDPDELRRLITPRTKMLLINSPTNPTGLVYSPEILAALAEIAQKHNLWVISDEIYSQQYFTERPPASICALPGMAERTILMDGFSKAYAMTGWRLGFGLFPAPLVPVVLPMISNTYSCIPLFIQDAGLAALHGPQDFVSMVRKELRLRRDMVISALAQAPGIRCPTPEGSLYAIIHIEDLGNINGRQLNELMLQAGVSLLPGELLGDHGDKLVRLAYTVDRGQLSSALERIRSVLNGL